MPGGQLERGVAEHVAQLGDREDARARGIDAGEERGGGGLRGERDVRGVLERRDEEAPRLRELRAAQHGAVRRRDRGLGDRG